MLEFFRKYQRYFFIFITIVIIASFSFFGTYSADNREVKKEDRVLARAVDGSPLMLSEVQALSRFISSDREDAAQPGVVPNLCNDGVVRYDLLRTGLADLLVFSYFETIKQEFESRLDRVKRFRPYAHPQVPRLNAEAVWEQFFPAMKKELASLKEETEASVSTFSHLSKLYQQQSYLSSETLRRILYYQQQHMGLQIDPSLQHGDLSLFGFHSLTDWFGRDFLTLSAEFILNAAAQAEKKGYKVSLEEAKGDLYLNFHTSLKKLNPDPSQATVTFSQHLRTHGFDEKTAAETWRKVLLFRRYFQGVSQTAFVDRLPFTDFASYARETAECSLYRWPQALRLRNIDDLVEFQSYLNAVSPEMENPLALPLKFNALEEVEVDYPELVQASFKAKVKEVSLGEVALRAPVAKVWEWQLNEKNWDSLKSTFSFLSQGTTRDERFKSLEKLSPAERSQIDSLTRRRLLEEHPEWTEGVLANTPSQDQTLSISKATASLSHVEKPWRLRGLLKKAALGDMEAKEELLSYSDDGKTLYRIEEAAVDKEPHILTFTEAKRQGVMAKIADRNLTTAYPKIRNKSPAKFQTEAGAWKPLAEVKGDVAKAVFPDLFPAIEELEEKAWTNDLYAHYRLLPTARAAFKALQKNPEDPKWISKEQTDILEEQFKLERAEMPVQRTSQEEWMKEKAFVMMPNEWSPIRVPPNGDISFFYLIDKKPCDKPVLDQIGFGKELIAADAQRYLAEKLLESIFQTRSIVVPVEGDK